MSSAEFPTKRRPVPPPKTESQAQLRQQLLSPKNASDNHQVDHPPQRDGDGPDGEAQRREAIKHLDLPPGWDLTNRTDVTYHTHIAKPVVHETIRHEITEFVEPKITRHIHYYHKYPYIQPLEVEIPDDCYATNAKGEVIHVPGGLTKHSERSSYWEQEREDKGFGLGYPLSDGKHREQTDPELGRDNIAGPFPIESEGGGERVLREIREGGIAKRFGGPLTSPATPTSQLDSSRTSAEIHSAARARPRGGGFEEAVSYHQSPAPNPPQTPPQKHSTHPSRGEHSSPNSDLSLGPSGNTQQSIHRHHQHPEAKPLPSLPDTSPRSPNSRASVRRMSADQKLRERFSMDSNRVSLDVQSTILDDEASSKKTSSVRKRRIS